MPTDLDWEEARKPVRELADQQLRRDATADASGVAWSRPEQAASAAPPMLDLDAIEKRALAATRGPWECRGWDEFGVSQKEPAGETIAVARACYPEGSIGLHEHDAIFIAHAREDVPALVARVRKLEAAVGEVLYFDETYGAGVNLDVLRDALK